MKKIPVGLLVGKTYNKLTILKFVGRKNNKRIFRCLCECGNEVDLPLSSVKNGYIKSCGCSKGIHKLSRTRLYHIWIGIKQRCNNKNCSIYYKYGGKGIKVCKEWESDFMEFYNWAKNNGYSDNLSIDRIDNNKGYSPENCRWATYYEQNTNLSVLKTNKSGYVGVSWSKQTKKWLCNISINNKTVRIGSYKTQKEAVEARNDFIDKNNLKHQKNIYTGEKVVKD